MKNPASQDREAAQSLAIAALAYIAAEPETLDRFLALTGIAPERIRAAAREPQFLVGVLDHVLGEERLLLAFAQNAGIDPADIARAREALGRRWERDVP